MRTALVCLGFIVGLPLLAALLIFMLVILSGCSTVPGDMSPSDAQKYSRFFKP